MDEKGAQQLLQGVLGATELRPVVLSLPAANVTPRVVEGLRRLVRRHPGSLPVRVKVVNGERSTVMELPVTVANSIRAEARIVFGPNVCEE